MKKSYGDSSHQGSFNDNYGVLLKSNWHNLGTLFLLYIHCSSLRMNSMDSTATITTSLKLKKKTMTKATTKSRGQNEVLPQTAEVIPLRISKLEGEASHSSTVNIKVPLSKANKGKK